MYNQIWPFGVFGHCPNKGHNWCNIVTGNSTNSTLTIGLVYQSRNMNEEDNRKLQNAIKEVSKGECITMGDFNHGHIQWKSLESTGVRNNSFYF